VDERAAFAVLANSSRSVKNSPKVMVEVMRRNASFVTFSGESPRRSTLRVDSKRGSGDEKPC